MTSTARALKQSSKAAESIQPIMQSQNHSTSYLWPWGRTHTQGTNIPTSRTKEVSRNQAWAGHRPACAWLKMDFSICDHKVSFTKNSHIYVAIPMWDYTVEPV